MSLSGVHVAAVWASNLPEGGVWLDGPRSWVLDGPLEQGGLGVAAVEKITKAAAERRFVGVSFERVLRGAVLDSVTATVTAGDVQVLDQSVYSSTMAKIMVAAGTAGTTSTVRVTAQGADGQLAVYDFQVEVGA